MAFPNCKFVREFPLNKLTKVDYNPRSISDESKKRLKESIEKFGVVIPVLVNSDDESSIIGGHQRTQSMRELGFTHTPAFIFEKTVGLSSEIRFNIIHNLVENETSKVNIVGKIPDTVDDFFWINPSNIKMVKRGNGHYIKEITSLVNKFGAWGSIVINEENEIIHFADYAIAAKFLRKPILVYRLPTSKSEEFKKYMGYDYGEFDYDHLPIATSNQHHVQPHRCNNASGKSRGSKLYDNYVIKDMRRDYRYFDLGAGEKSYVKLLRDKKYNIQCYEPNVKSPGTNAGINVREVVQDIVNTFNDVNKYGRQYDVVICDSVLNSVVDEDMMTAILTTANLLTAPSGKFITQTRNKTGKTCAFEGDSKATRDHRSVIEPFDSLGRVIRYNGGQFVVQWFLTPVEFLSKLGDYFGVVNELSSRAHTEEYLKASCSNPLPLKKRHAKKYLNMEFNINYNGYYHNKQDILVDKLIELGEEQGRIE